MIPFCLILITGIPISLIDLKTLHISNRILIPGIALSFLYHLKTVPYESSFMIDGTGAAALMSSVYLSSGKKMGTGDIKYSFFLGSLSGLPVWMTGTGIFLGLWLIYLRMTNPESLDTNKPAAFAPLLTMGALFSQLIKGILI